MVKPGQIAVVGVGPGDAELMTPQAAAALRAADVVIGYAGYFAWVEKLIADKERIGFPLGQETERAHEAFRQASAGRRVVVISSGDPGIYAMAGLVLELLPSVAAGRRPDVTVVPGVSALNAAAALLGAPLGHDFAAISLSDLLTPWPNIEKKLAAAADADFVLALFNPRSRRRDWQLSRAREILLRYRNAGAPVGIVQNAFRPGQHIALTTLGEMDVSKVNMFAIVFVGNSTSRFVENFMMTPRGYMQPNINGTPIHDAL
jgi:precorrin-3B C17-methyltransferase